LHNGQCPWAHRHLARKNVRTFSAGLNIAFLLQNAETT
jgi:hypothetical protein